MDGFTVSNANKFLDTGRLNSTGDRQSLQIDKTNGSAATAGASFAETLNQAVGSVNEMQKTADKAMQDLATGKTDNIADVMIAAEKADIALKVMVQVRNKIIDAYQEVMKMQV
jgi:flagellar hook-basal body complex protein FliE